MPPDTTDQLVYFDTLARAERLQLVRHLVRNANESIYLRGPAGSGKTHFSHRLLDQLGDEIAAVWLNAAIDDMPTAVARELDLPEAVSVPLGGSSWLVSRKPDRYTLQLVGGRERSSVEKFIRINGIKPPYAIFKRQLQGRPWYSLVAGDYADRDEAVTARAALPRRLRDAGVWPRTFESINNAN